MALSTTIEPRIASWKSAIRFGVAHRAVAPGAALFISAAGWSLMWARALGLIHIVPQWLSIFCFFGGIALIAIARPGRS